MQLTGFEVDVCPSQAPQFACPQSGQGGRQKQGASLGIIGGSYQPLDLIGGRDVHPDLKLALAALETSFSDFGIVDLSTGQFTLFGNAGQTLAGLGNYGGNLYAGINTGTNFYQVNPANGSLTFIGNSGVSIVADYQSL
jgi:hypothetical protein